MTRFAYGNFRSARLLKLSEKTFANVSVGGCHTFIYIDDGDKHGPRVREIEREINKIYVAQYRDETVKIRNREVGENASIYCEYSASVISMTEESWRLSVSDRGFNPQSIPLAQSSLSFSYRAKKI